MAAAVVVDAGRLLGRHWPVLLALFFAGRAARELVMVAAVRASLIHGVLGGLVFVLVPVSTLAALVLMLRVLLTSLSGGGGAAGGGDAAPAGASGAPRRLLDATASVLVPFLAVYASYGYLKKDGREYLYRVFHDEVLDNAALLTNPGKVDVASRLPFTVGVTLASTVAIAVVLRWLLARWDGARRRAWPAVVGGYLEVAWITLVARQISLFKKAGNDWIGERRIVRWIGDTWTHVTESVRGTGGPLKVAVSWVDSLVGSIDTVIIVPIAWLAVGAVVYGYKLTPLGAPSHALYQRAAGRLARGPRTLRRAATELGTDIYGRFKPLVNGLRVVFHAGWRPMLVFWLAFLVAQTAPQWLWELERMIIGPRDLGAVWSPLSGPLGLVNEAVGAVLLACLLAAAVDRALRAQPAEPAELGRRRRAAGLGPGLGRGRSAAGQPRVGRELRDQRDPHRHRARGRRRHEVGHGLVRQPGGRVARHDDDGGVQPAIGIRARRSSVGLASNVRPASSSSVSLQPPSSWCAPASKTISARQTRTPGGATNARPPYSRRSLTGASSPRRSRAPANVTQPSRPGPIGARGSAAR